MKIGYFTDPHFREAVPGTSSGAERMSRMMKDAVARCLGHFRDNKVDIIICTGDIVDDPVHLRAEEDLRTMRDMIEGASIPGIIIAGNHDPAPGIFYSIFKCPGKTVRIGDCEFINFFEDTCPGGELTCTRTDSSLEEMRSLLNRNPPGIKYTLLIQHYLIYPEHNEGYPHNYKNDSVIRQIMEESPRKIFSISGHDHRGFPVTRHNGVTYFCGRALCVSPFTYYILDTEGDEITIKEEVPHGSTVDTARQP